MNRDEAEHISELLKIHKKRLNILEEQSAKYGLNSPPEIRMEIEELREKVDHFDRQVKGNIIETFVQGKNTLRQFNLDLDAIEHGLSNVVIKEERAFRFLGIPLWSSVVIRTITTLVAVVSMAGLIYIIVGKERLGQVIGLFPTMTPVSLPTSVPIPAPTALPIPAPTALPAPAQEPSPPPPPSITSLPIVRVKGVISQYDFTNRIATDAIGAFTKMREAPDVNSQRIGLLRNGDGVALLRSDVPDWYQVRIVESSDTAQIGLEGWVERWLIDNTNAPPTPRPAPPTRRPPTQLPTAMPEPTTVTAEPPTTPVLAATLEPTALIPEATATSTSRPKPPPTPISPTPIPPTATNTPIPILATPIKPTPISPTPIPPAATNTPIPTPEPSRTPTPPAPAGRE
jgi:hypothetical protein